MAEGVLSAGRKSNGSRVVLRASVRSSSSRSRVRPRRRSSSSLVRLSLKGRSRRNSRHRVLVVLSRRAVVQTQAQNLVLSVRKAATGTGRGVGQAVGTAAASVHVRLPALLALKVGWESTRQRVLSLSEAKQTQHECSISARRSKLAE